MTQLTSVQQELIRKRPQSSRLNLVLFQPREIFRAQINDASITRGARTITYNNVSLGDYSSIEANFTLLVGTTLGSQDVGRIRVRSATSSTIVVSENSNINWQNGLYLTVIRFVDLNPIYPRIIQNPSDPEQVIFYKDYDILYTNQNSILGTFPCAGPHRPVLLESNGTGTTWYSSTGTHNLLAHGLTYNWAFEGGFPTGSTSADPGYVAYNTPGNYVTRLIVTDSVNGAQDTTYRYVAVRNKVGEGSNTPIVNWTMEELDGSRREGGYSVKFTLYDSVSIDSNAIVMLVSDDWYGDTHQSFGGNYPNVNSIFFVGIVDKDSIHYDYEESFVQFEVLSLTKLMKESLGFSISVESKASPSTWYELLDMDVRRALYHYLRWHTTVLSIADFRFIGTDYKIQYFDSDRASMFDAIDNIMRSALLGEVVSDRQGMIWAEVNARAYPNPTGTFSSNFDISKRDWKDSPDVDEKFSDTFSYIEYDGIQYSGSTTGTFAPLIACAPGSAPSFRGKIEKLSGLALGGQPQLNQMIGNMFANKNSRYPSIRMQMGNNLSNLDIAPQESNRIIISPSDTVRGISLDSLYTPDGITWNYDAKNGLLLPRLRYENLVNGIVGESIIIPSTPDAGGLNNGFNVPSLRVPNIPPFNPFSTVNILGGVKFNPFTQDISLTQGFATLGFGGAFSFAFGDTVSYGSSSGTISEVTAQRSGVYLINVNVRAEGNAISAGNAYILAAIAINGNIQADSTDFIENDTTAYNPLSTSLSDIYMLSPGDVIQAFWKRNIDVSEVLVSMSVITLFAF